MKNRKAITIFDEDSAITLVKPFSDVYRNQIFAIHEDAYGEIIGVLTTIDELKIKLNLSDDEYNNIINNL